MIKKSPRFKRTILTSDQLLLIKACYLIDNYPDEECISSIAVICNVKYKTIKNWYQNARQRQNILFDSYDELNATRLICDVI